MNGLTVIAKIVPGKANTLRALLREIDQNPSDNPYVRLDMDTLTHSARWYIIDEDPTASDGAQLVLAVEFDGDLEPYLAQQVAISPGLDTIWGNIEGYEGAATFLDFIRQNAMPTQAMYIAFRDETVQTIRARIAARQELEKLLDRGGPAAKELMAALSLLPVNRGPWRRFTDWMKRVRASFHEAWLSLGLKILEPISQIGQSKTFPEVTSFVKNPLTPRAQKLSRLNGQMLTVTTIRPCLLWRARAAFYINEFIAKYGWPPGVFTDTRTLFSFRWVLFEKNKRLLFISTFTGQWANYMGDFIDKIIWALDGVYNNTQDYPKAGMKDVIPFQRWILNHQYQPELFYRAYPEEGVLNLLRDRRSTKKIADILQTGFGIESDDIREILQAL